MGRLQRPSVLTKALTRKEATNRVHAYLLLMGFTRKQLKQVIVTVVPSIPDARGITYRDENGYVIIILEASAPEKIIRHEVFHTAWSLVNGEEKLAHMAESTATWPVVIKLIRGLNKGRLKKGLDIGPKLCETESKR